MGLLDRFKPLADTSEIREAIRLVAGAYPRRDREGSSEFVSYEGLKEIVRARVASMDRRFDESRFRLAFKEAEQASEIVHYEVHGWDLPITGFPAVLTPQRLERWKQEEGLATKPGAELRFPADGPFLALPNGGASDESERTALYQLEMVNPAYADSDVEFVDTVPDSIEEPWCLWGHHPEKPHPLCRHCCARHGVVGEAWRSRVSDHFGGPISSAHNRYCGSCREHFRRCECDRPGWYTSEWEPIPDDVYSARSQRVKQELAETGKLRSKNRGRSTLSE